MSVPDWLWLLNWTDICLSEGFTSCSAQHDNSCRDSKAAPKKLSHLFGYFCQAVQI